MSEDKDIFTRISSFDERMKLFEDLARAKAEVLCKGKEDAVIRLRSQNLNYAEGYLDCTVEKGTPVKDAEEVLGHFFLGSEKYYFQATVSLMKNRVHLVLSENVFHLQRRQNYRVRIPENYKAHFNIVKVNGTNLPIPGQIADLSGGGCRVLYMLTSPLMKLDDTVVGSLAIGKRDPIELTGVVRHIKIDSVNSSLQNFGIEFTSLTPIIENRLFALTMDLYKEIFKRV